MRTSVHAHTFDMHTLRPFSYSASHTMEVVSSYYYSIIEIVIIGLYSEFGVITFAALSSFRFISSRLVRALLATSRKALRHEIKAFRWKYRWKCLSICFVRDRRPGQVGYDPVMTSCLSLLYRLQLRSVKCIIPWYIYDTFCIISWYINNISLIGINDTLWYQIPYSTVELHMSSGDHPLSDSLI
jgi:hypothetical protein